MCIFNSIYVNVDVVNIIIYFDVVIMNIIIFSSHRHEAFMIFRNRGFQKSFLKIFIFLQLLIINYQLSIINY